MKCHSSPIAKMPQLLMPGSKLSSRARYCWRTSAQSVQPLRQCPDTLHHAIKVSKSVIDTCHARMQLIRVITLTLLVAHAHGTTICLGKESGVLPCPDQAKPCIYMLSTATSQVYLHKNSTYVITDETRLACSPTIHSWDPESYQEVQDSSPPSIPSYRYCQTVNGSLRIGSISFCPIWVRLRGSCVVTQVTSNSITIMPLTSKAGVLVRGAIEWKGTILSSTTLTVNSDAKEETTIDVRCGSDSMRYILGRDKIEECIGIYSPIYRFSYLAEFRCTHPALFLTLIVVLIQIAVTKALSMSGLDFILYPVYALVAASIYIPVKECTSKLWRCPNCRGAKLPCHTCPKACCGASFPTKSGIYKHRLTKGCHELSIQRSAGFLSKSAYPKLLNFMLIVIVLCILVPTGKATNIRQVGCESPLEYPSCSIIISEDDCIIMEELISTKLDCPTLMFFGYLAGHGMPAQRTKRALDSRTATAPTTPGPDFDPSTASPVQVTGTSIVEGHLSGKVQVTIPAQTGQSRLFTGKTPASVSDVSFSVHVISAICTHETLPVYKTCRLTSFTNGITESCTGDVDACSAPLPNNTAGARKIWPDVQNWGCEEPGCLAINSGCLGATCVSVPTTDCCDVLEPTPAVCSMELCTRINGQSECQKVTRGVESGGLHATWTRQDSSILLKRQKLALCEGSILHGDINELGNHGDGFGAYQLLGQSSNFKSDPIGYYRCHSIGYKEVVFSQCIVDTWSRKSSLTHAVGLTYSEGVVTETLLDLGLATVTITMNDVIVKELADVTQLTVTSVECEGEANSPRGLLCHAQIVSDSAGIVRVDCATMTIAEPRLPLQPGSQSVEWYGHVGSTGPHEDNCTVTGSTEKVTTFRVRYDAKPMAMYDSQTEAYFAYQQLHSNAKCTDGLCSVYRGITGLFNGAFTVWNVVYGVGMLALVVALVYVVVYGCVKLGLSMRAQLSVVQKEYVKIA